MAIIPGITGQKAELFDGAKIDAISEYTATKGVAVQGRTDGAQQDSSAIGSRISSLIPFASKISLTTNVASDVGSILLPAGVWDITLIGVIQGSPTGWTGCYSWTSPYPGNDQTGLVGADNEAESTVTPTSGVGVFLTVPNYRVTPSVSTRYYLKAFAVFTGGTCAAFGRITAVRAQ